MVQFNVYLIKKIIIISFHLYFLYTIHINSLYNGNDEIWRPANYLFIILYTLNYPPIHIITMTIIHVKCVNLLLEMYTYIISLI